MSLEEAKAYLRVDTNDDDATISALIAAAREYCEGYQNRAYVTQTLELTLDGFPRSDGRARSLAIRIPRPPLQSVESVAYTDDTGATTTLDASTYIVDTDSEPGCIVPAVGTTWPCVHLQPVNGVRIRYVAGYGPADHVPRTVKQAMMMLVAHWYEQREAVLAGSISKETEFAVTALLSMDRVVPV